MEYKAIRQHTIISDGLHAAGNPLCKTFLNFMLVVVCAISVLASCSKDDDTIMPEDNTPYLTQMVVGRKGTLTMANGVVIENGERREVPGHVILDETFIDSYWSDGRVVKARSLFTLEYPWQYQETIFVDSIVFNADTTMAIGNFVSKGPENNVLGNGKAELYDIDKSSIPYAKRAQFTLLRASGDTVMIYTSMSMPQNHFDYEVYK